MVTKFDPTTHGITMSQFPNLIIRKHPDDPSPLTQLAVDTVGNLEKHLSQKLSPETPGRVFLDGRGNEDQERKQYEQLRPNLYSRLKQQDEGAISLHTPSYRSRTTFPTLNIARALSTGHILKSITESPEARKKIKLFKDSVVEKMARTKTPLSSHSAFLKSLGLQPDKPVNIGNLLGAHIWDHLRLVRDTYSPQSLLAHFKDPIIAQMHTPYNKHFATILQELLEHHLQGHK